AGFVLWQVTRPGPRVSPVLTGSPVADTRTLNAAPAPPAPPRSVAASELRVAWRDGPFNVLAEVSTPEHSSPRILSGSVFDERTGAELTSYSVPAIVKGVCPDGCEISAKVALDPGSRTPRVIPVKLNVRREGGAIVVLACPQPNACRKAIDLS